MLVWMWRKQSTCIVSGNMNCCSHCEKEYGGFLKKL